MRVGGLEQEQKLQMVRDSGEEEGDEEGNTERLQKLAICKQNTQVYTAHPAIASQQKMNSYGTFGGSLSHNVM